MAHQSAASLLLQCSVCKYWAQHCTKHRLPYMIDRWRQLQSTFKLSINDLKGFPVPVFLEALMSKEWVRHSPVEALCRVVVSGPASTESSQTRHADAWPSGDRHCGGQTPLSPRGPLSGGGFWAWLDKFRPHSALMPGPLEISAVGAHTPIPHGACVAH